MTLEQFEHILLRGRRRVATRITLFCLAAAMTITSPALAATGIRMLLDLPRPAVAHIHPAKPQIGFAQSTDSLSLPLLKAETIERRLTFNYDRESDLLVFRQGYGRFHDVSMPATASPTGYRQWLLETQNRRLFRESYAAHARRAGQGGGGSLLQFQIPFEVPRFAKSIMGEGGAGLKVSGYRRISFAGRSQWKDATNTATQKQSKFPSLNMEQQSSFTINGNVGSKITVDVKQDSKVQQALANRIALRYKGDEDDVVKTIELGNTNLSLPGTRFTGYSRQIQGLFGIKTTAELGGLRLTAIASQEKSSNQGASFKAGSESQTKVIRDFQYLDMTYFDLARRDAVSEGDLVPGDSITELELWFSVNNNYGSDQYAGYKKNCRLFVDPFDAENTAYDAENVRGVFVPFEKNPSYSGTYFSPLGHYVIMPMQMSGISIGAYIKYKRKGNDGKYGAQEYEIGHKPDSVDATSERFYSLKLIANASPLTSYVTWNYVWRNVYSLGGRIESGDALELQIYRGEATSTADRDASDQDNQNGVQYIKLLQIDDGQGRVNGYNEQIVDRDRGHLRFPFSPTPFADAVLNEQAPGIYGSVSDRQKSSKYYLLVKSSTRESEFYLGHPDIVSESETVTLNGKQLKRDVDYRIYYDVGRIAFTNQEALNPGADVRVDYEYAPLIAAEKKSLLGVRGEYQLGTNFKVGGTVLYKSEKTTDRKPRLGEEQSKSLNLDTDASYSFQSGLLTRMVDALPFIESNVPSQISVNGEVARSIPNANVSGEAYIDDFEGARERFSIGVIREGWKRSSIPEQKHQSGYTKPSRLIWYNPYNQYKVTDIWDREVKTGENKTHVLVMRLTPDKAHGREGWGGVMRAFSQGSYDQSKTQFIEMRVRGKTGVLHIDLGEITEDLPDKEGNTNGRLDTEDQNGNNLLDEGEDIGLDLRDDDQEREDCACPDPDPNGDNWSYDSRDPDNYERINGTQGNARDPGTNQRPDTEDIDGQGGFDIKNNYYSYSVDLSTDEGVVPGSYRSDTRWYTIRIPFTAAYVKDSIGTPSREKITRIRLWIDGVDKDTAYVEIAELLLTRNVWEIQPILPTTALRNDSAGLSVAVVNTEENRDYYPPPGVSGYLDKVNDIREKEQSLSLKFRELLPGDTAYAEKIPFKVQDLTSYRDLRMWVHGDSIRDSVEFFVRFGNDAKNYYEYRTTIDTGWSEKGSVDVILDDLTQLKLLPADTTDDSTGVVEQAHPHYRVVGLPSLTKIKYYAVGIVNRHSSESQKLASGELWVNELRTTSVRNDQGLAAVAAASIGLADLGSIRVDYSTQDAFYRNLTQSNRGNLGSGSSATNYGYSADVRLDKFLSPSERASIPISYSWRRTESSPRLFTGSDIVVTPDRVDDQKSVSTSTRFQIGESFNKQTKNIIYGALLNRFNSNFAYDKTISRSPTVPNYESERYTLKGRYALTSPLKRGLKMLSWMRGMPLVPKRVLNTELRPFPSRLSLDGTVNRTLENQTNSYGVETNRYQRTFQGRFETAAAPINSMDLSYSFNTDRDLSDPERLEFSLSPKQAKLGTERTYSQSFSATYGPQVLPFVTGTKFSYAVNHGETMVLTSTRVTDIGTRRADNGRNFTANATLDLGKLLGKNKPPARKPTEKRLLPSGKGTPADSASTKKGSGKGKEPKAPADTLIDKPVFKDSTKTPVLDSVPKGNNIITPEPPASDSLSDSTKSDGKKAAFNLPKSLGQTFALVMTEANPDTGKNNPPPQSPPKGDKGGDDDPGPAPSPPQSDSVRVKTDSTGVVEEKGKIVAPEDSLPHKPSGVHGDSAKVKRDSTVAKFGETAKKPKVATAPGNGFFGLRLLRFFTDRVDPITGSWKWEERAVLNGFTERPSFLYRIGLSDDPQADRVLGTSSSSTVDSKSWSRGYSLRTNVSLILGIKVGTVYTYGTSDATGKVSQDETKTFPDLTFTFGNIDYLLFPKLISKSMKVESRYAQRLTSSARLVTPTDTTKRRYRMKTSETKTTEYSPLVKVSIDWKFAQGLQSSFNYARTITDRHDWNSSTGTVSAHVTDNANTLSVRTTYSFRGGSKLWLPLFGRVMIQSAMSFDLDISQRLNRSVNNLLTTNKVTAERRDFSVQPRVTYNFSTNIKGGMSARWQDSKDLKNAPSHVRELEFWVEIRF